jgi:hypothetical protein
MSGYIPYGHKLLLARTSLILVIWGYVVENFSGMFLS